MVRRRQLMGMQKSELPSEYKRIGYLEGNGTQYIATNYVPTANETSTDFIYQYLVSISSDDMIYGASTGNVAYYAEEYNAGRWYAALGLSRYSNIQWSGYANNLAKSHATINLESLTVTNMETGVSHTGNSNNQYSSFSMNIPIYIFAWNYKNGTPEYIHRGLRLFDLKLFRSNALSAHFIPCIRKSDNKPGMYDTVSKTFYTNAGTGEFIVPN